MSGDFFLARYESDGTLDAGFGNGGRVVTGFEGNNVEAVALVVQPDGKFVVAGFHPVPDTEHDLLVLARYEPDGSLNVITNFEGGLRANDLALLRSGRLVVAGSCKCDGRNLDFGLARYNADGSLDESFGDGARQKADASTPQTVAFLVGTPSPTRSSTAEAAPTSRT